MIQPQKEKPAEFIGTSKEDLQDFPDAVRAVMGYAIYLAQIGGKHRDAKPLRGGGAFKGAGVLEVVDDYDGDTFRSVYTVKFAGVLYVLHAFQKKSKTGNETPKHEIDLIKERYDKAKEHYEENHLKKQKAG